MLHRHSDGQILICCDGSDDAVRAIDVAAALLGAHRATVVDVTPAMTFAEGIAATSALVPGTAFEAGNLRDAELRAATHAGRPVLIVPPPAHGPA
jgi:hypothetical protein